MQVPVAVSARHIHLSNADLQVLFGNDYELQILRELSQHGQFAAKETVRIETDKGCFPTVRVIGPVRRKTQVEISRTDAVKLGMNPPVRISGDLLHSPGIKIIGPNGTLHITEGVIIASRHIHMTPEIAEQLGVKERQTMSVRLGGARPFTMERVHARISPIFSLELHIDTDDANAAGVVGGDLCEIISVQPFNTF